ncbi:MAG: hypothetical protein RBT11_13760 [Desulfobacterales bacterium]|jgi:hypothetical protein|nr:hypothetical protein [Desulfobacterales bacterium]
MSSRPNTIVACAEAGGEATTLSERCVAQVTRIEFVGGQRLQIERGEYEDLLTLIAPSGEATFSIRITPSGPVMRFERGLRIESSGPLEFAGKSLSLSGAEGVSIRSGGDATIDAVGDLSSTARVQTIKARLGNVNVKANDDVRLTGERVRLNC